jgi:hypothetical protein
MGQFTVRVQLRKVAEDDEAYETLHAEMKKRSFSRTIKGSEGTAYELPWGTYNYEGERSIDKVLEKAKEAAELTGHKARILVTESEHRKWSGLKKS